MIHASSRRPHGIAAILTVVALGVLPAAQAQVGGNTLTLLPANPVTFDQLVARIVTKPACQIDPQTIRVSQKGTTIRIDVSPRDGCIAIGGATHDIAVGRFPTGAFNVEVFDGEVMLVDPGHFVVSDSQPTKSGPFPSVDFSDYWWSPPELGSALAIMQHPRGGLFATWYVYNPSGQPVWYTLQSGQWLNSNTCCTYTGTIYKTSGPYFGDPFDPSRVAIFPVGTGKIVFQDFMTGEFSYAAEGVSSARLITRFPF